MANETLEERCEREMREVRKRMEKARGIAAPPATDSVEAGRLDAFPSPEEIASRVAAIAPNGYGALARALGLALAQSAVGKGRERHANEKPFHKQPIMEIGRMVGIGGHTYQICKKAQEATGMVARDQLEAAKAELLGVMVYAAAGVLLIEEKQGAA